MSVGKSGTPPTTKKRRGASAFHRKMKAPGRSISDVAKPPLRRFAGFNRSGMVDIAEFAKHYKMTNQQIAETAGLASTAVAKAERRDAQKTQTRMREMVEILELIKEWAGGEMQAMAWYRAQPIPALNGRTSEQLVKDGQATAVREYIDHLTVGGYA